MNSPRLLSACVTAFCCGLFLHHAARASTTVCVHSPAELQTALNNATGSTDTTFIDVARGSYALSGAQLVFDSTAVGQGQLDITGGYSDDCSALIKNPALTVLNGQGLSGVLRLISTGGISVRYLTIQNGVFAAQTGTDVAGLYVATSDGGLIVDYNIVRNNTGADNAGVEIVIQDAAATAALHAEGNLIVGNTATNGNGAGLIENGGTGVAYITNNTIADNVTQRTGSSATGGLAVYGNTTPASATLSNNVFWHNTGNDLYLYLSPVLVNNDYTLSDGSGGTGSTGNVSVDPQFAAANDYHLAPTSPLLGAGTLTPAGGLPTIDIEGHPRSYNNLVDLGAYEYGDAIYADGFDN